MQNPGIKYGLVAGFIGILLQTFMYLMGVQFMATWWVGILVGVLLIVMYVILSIRIRKDNGGFITFKEAFVRIFLMCVIASVLSTLFGLLLYHVIDPELPQRMQDAVTEKTIAFMEKMGAPQDKIDETADSLKDMAQKFTVFGQIKSFFSSVLIGAIFALIMGAIIKKNKPVFEETQDKPQS